MEISPIDEIAKQPCQKETPPPSRIYWGTRSSYDYSARYAFTQNATEYSAKLSFTVAEFVYVRSTITYDFMWSDLVVRILNNDSSVVALGENGYNRNEISAFQLPPGQYEIEIFEPLPQKEELRHCSEFTFAFAIAPVQVSTTGAVEGFVPCEVDYPPVTFDQIAFKSAFSANSVHFGQALRMDVVNKRWHIDFTVTEQSVFRAVVPPHRVNIDIELDSVDEDGDKTSIAKSRGYGEETLFTRLQPGSYQFRFKFFRNYRDHQTFPDPDECVSFPVEMALIPVTIAEGLMSKTQPPCGSIPSTALLDRRVVKPLTRPITSTPWKATVSFDLHVASLLQAELNYAFVSGGVYFTLTGTNVWSPYLSSATNRTYHSHVAKDSAYLDELLWPGSYQLVRQYL